MAGALVCLKRGEHEHLHQPCNDDHRADHQTPPEEGTGLSARDAFQDVRQLKPYQDEKDSVEEELQ